MKKILAWLKKGKTSNTPDTVQPPRYADWGSSTRFHVLVTLATGLIFAWDGLCRRRMRLLERQLPLGWEGEPPGDNLTANLCVRRGILLQAGDRTLTARWMAPTHSPDAAVLLFHGIGDRIDYWRNAQRFLAQADLSLLIFHYSGYSGGLGRATPENLEEDAEAAFRWLRGQTSAESPLFFCLGSRWAAGWRQRWRHVCARSRRD